MSARAAMKQTGVFSLPAARRTTGPTARHYLSVVDLSHGEIDRLLGQAAAIKSARAAHRRMERPLEGQHVALLFEKPSLRTRSTFTIAVRELGGDVIEPPADVALGGRETIGDVARNLERWVTGCVVRTYAQRDLKALAAAVHAHARDQRPDR